MLNSVVAFVVAFAALVVAVKQAMTQV